MYRKAITGWLKHMDFMLLDILCLEIAFFLGYLIRHGSGHLERYLSYSTIFCMIPVALIVVTFLREPYKGIIRRGKLKECWKVFTCNVEVYAMLILYLFLIKETAKYSRMVILVSAPISILLMIVIRLTWKKLLEKKLVKVEKTTCMVVVASGDVLVETIENLQKNDYGKHKIVTIMLTDDDNSYGNNYQEIPIVKSKDALFEYCTQNIVDEVFVRTTDNQLLSVITQQTLEMGIPVHIGITSMEEQLPNQIVEKIGSYTVVTSSINVMTLGQQALKRFMDICGALVGLAITGILFVIFAPIIYIQSPGSIFFAQERVGQNGRKFKIYKFRSMYLDAEERKKELMEQNKMNGLMFKMDDDPRIIPIGKFIRKTSIDEFPQFWNVLKGDMSLVGTRPPTVDEYEQYEPHHKRRLAFKPGITGLWQVSGRSGITDFEQVVKLDTEYIENWSVGMDIKILFKTVKVVLVREGSV